MTKNEDIVFLNNDFKESWLWKINDFSMAAVLIDLFLSADTDNHIYKTNINNLLNKYRCTKQQLFKALKLFCDFNFIQIYKTSFKNNIIIACRKNEYIAFPGKETYFDDKYLYTFPQLRGRLDQGYSKWRFNCLKRDNYTCQKCGSKEFLCVHHIKPYALYPNLRTQISNGITLCKNCHKQIHSKGVD